MAIVNHFYHATTRRYIAIFGSIFNKLVITRDDNDKVEQQKIVVPIAYGPYQKFLARITQDPEFQQKSAITLPRMSFEILSMMYEGHRKISSTQKLSLSGDDVNRNTIYSPAPYNLEFNLYIMTKHSEDGTKIIEQIIPFFKPEYTISANIIDELPPFDIPLVLNSVHAEDIYESDFETRRSLLWTLSFTMKCYYFGPIRSKKIIKFVDSRLYTDIDPNKMPSSIITVQPGLTANGNPTSSIDETIPYEEIEIDDDWGIITIVRDYDEESD